MSTLTKEETKTGVERIPAGMHTVTPHLICAGAADAIEFYKKAFGAVELCRIPGGEGKVMHASIQIGDSVVMLNDEAPQWCAFGPKSLKGSPVTIHLYVEDADAAFAQAVAAGAKATMPLEDMLLGRSLREGGRSLWASVVDRHPCARRHAGGNAKGDAGDVRLTKSTRVRATSPRSRQCCRRNRHRRPHPGCDGGDGIHRQNTIRFLPRGGN